MEPSVQVFWLPKLGNAEDEYEDASAFSASARRFAISDGATESSFADRWARALVQRYADDPPPSGNGGNDLADWLLPLQQAWQTAISWETLPWYAEEKARDGAFASFLGLTIQEGTEAPRAFSLWNWLWGRAVRLGGKTEPAWRWQALAVGDSCLFQVREDRLLACFPMQQAAEFNSRPLLLCSNPSRNQPVWRAVRTASGACEAGDCFLLVTDALGHWFLQEHETGHRPWRQLKEIQTRSEFADFVERLRATRALKNDDTTLLRLCWPNDPQPPTLSNA
jgi:hypothetical protein